MTAEFGIDRVDGESFAQGNVTGQMTLHQVEIMGLVCLVNKRAIKRKRLANQFERLIDNGCIYLFFNKHFCHCPDK